MFAVKGNDQRLIEKYLLGLDLADTVRVEIFSLIAGIPVEPGDLREIDHGAYITEIYNAVLAVPCLSEP
jgi:hypothetical protein